MSYRPTFEAQVSGLVNRFMAQNGQPALTEEESRRIATRLSAQVVARGLPRRLRPDEMGQPGELPSEELKAIVQEVLQDITASDATIDVTRQLVKACFYPEFKKCRESYREVNATGECRRQNVDRARERISGSHCVDCPYWTALTCSQGTALLSGAWRGEVREFETNREIFLPEDSRDFRCTLRAWAGEMQSRKDE
jgi:hypothetical protein